MTGFVCNTKMHWTK